MRYAGFLFLALVWFVGCTAPPRTTRQADIAARDFYTSDEIRGLSQEERDRYCAELEAEITRLRGEADSYDAAADSAAGLADSLRAANVEISTKIRDLDGEIRQLRLARRASTEYVIKAGDTLEKIASVVYGNAARWRDIYLANRDKIDEPQGDLKPGLRLRIPSKQ